MSKKILNKIKKQLDESNILIYQMGKVGSTSLENSLENSTHTHSFFGLISDQHNKNIRAQNYFSKRRKGCKIIYIVRLLKRMIVNNLIKSRKKIKIVTLVREPVSRNISMYFQDLPMYLLENQINGSRKEGNVLLEMFKKFNSMVGIQWFDNEFKKFTGIDIYKYPFNKEKGFLRIKEGKYDILILKMENMNSLESIISDFSGIKDFKLKNTNRGDKKWYAPLYKEFKKEFIPEEEYLYNLYESKFMQHFYTDEEIEKYKNKWLRKEK